MSGQACSMRLSQFGLHFRLCPRSRVDFSFKGLVTRSSNLDAMFSGHGRGPTGMEPRIRSLDMADVCVIQEYSRAFTAATVTFRVAVNVLGAYSRRHGKQRHGLPLAPAQQTFRAKAVSNGLAHFQLVFTGARAPVCFPNSLESDIFASTQTPESFPTSRRIL